MTPKKTSQQPVANLAPRLPPGFAAEVIAWHALGGQDASFYGANKRSVDLVDADGQKVQVKSASLKKRAVTDGGPVVDVVGINVSEEGLRRIAEDCAYLLAVTTSGSAETTTASVTSRDGEVVIATQTTMPMPRLFRILPEDFAAFVKESKSDRNDNRVLPLDRCSEFFLA